MSTSVLGTSTSALGVIVLGTESGPGIWNLSASNSFSTHAAIYSHTTGNKFVSATNGIVCGDTAGEFVAGSRPVIAGSGLVFHCTTKELTVGYKPVSAASGLVFAYTAYSIGNKFVSAASGFTVHNMSSRYDAVVIHASASSYFLIGDAQTIDIPCSVSYTPLTVPTTTTPLPTTPSTTTKLTSDEIRGYVTSTFTVSGLSIEVYGYITFEVELYNQTVTYTVIYVDNRTNLIERSLTFTGSLTYREYLALLALGLPTRIGYTAYVNSLVFTGASYVTVQYPGASGYLDNGGIATVSPAFWPLAAQTGLVLGVDAEESYFGLVFVSAASGITIGVTADEFVNIDQIVTATSGIILTSSATFDGYNWRASAQNGLIVTSAAGSNGFFLASAHTSLILANPLSLAVSFPPIIHLVVAYTGIVLSTSATGTTYATIKYATASSGLVLAVPASCKGDWAVAVANSVTLSTSSITSTNHTFSALASSGLVFSYAGHETRDALAAAHSLILVSSVTASARDIHASAMTTVSMSESTDSNEFPRAAGHTAIIMTGTGHSQLTGTLAESIVVFTTMARAVVVLPWRRNSLSFPPGGGLPHS